MKRLSSVRQPVLDVKKMRCISGEMMSRVDAWKEMVSPTRRLGRHIGVLLYTEIHERDTSVIL